MQKLIHEVFLGFYYLILITLTFLFFFLILIFNSMVKIKNRR